MADDWSMLFAADMPGVVTALVTPTGGVQRALVGHWYHPPRAPNRSDFVPLFEDSTRLVVPSDQAADLTRGAALTVSGRDYQITAVYADDHGLSTLEVDRA
jgi:hypothetical protein